VKIGIAGPATLEMLAHRVDGGAQLPIGRPFAPMASWIEALLVRGHEVALFTLSPEFNEPRTFRGEQLTIHIGRSRSRHRARDFFALERSDLGRAMTHDRCDILHAHWTDEFALAALEVGLPTLVTAHDQPLNVLRHHLMPYWIVRTAMSWQVVRRATFMTAVSDDVADHLRRVFRYRLSLTVIGNAVADSVFRLGRPGMRKANRPVTFATVLSVWSELKNNKGALQAFHKLREITPGVRLIMFGDQQGAGQEAETWARARGLAKDVEFAGMLPYDVLLSRLATDVDVLLHPSLVEAHSMAVTEGLALGLPVIAGTRTGGMKYLLEDGQAGVLIDVRSNQAMVDAMFRLAEDADLRARLGQAARGSSTRRFSTDHVMTAYEREYEQVIANWPSSPQNGSAAGHS
jgi:glycosyltransferase involved in cell wall biosynthesis